MHIRSLAVWGFLGLAILAVGTLGAEQNPKPYAGQEQRTLKAVSPEDMKALEAGEGMGLAKAAELNRYPGPKHVLDLAVPMGLSSEQRGETERIFRGMHDEAVRIGREILSSERELDQGFRTHTLGLPDLVRLTSTIGRLNGELRATHLQAHLRMAELLTPEQVERYQHLRGYADATGRDPAIDHESQAPHSQHHSQSR